MFGDRSSFGCPSPSVNLGSLELTKVVTLNGQETLKEEAQGYTFKFMVLGPDNYRKSVSIKVDKGSNKTLIKGLEPGQYKIIEYDLNKQFDLCLPVAVEINYNKTSHVTIENEYLEKGRPIPQWWIFEDLMTALGLVLPFNQAGDCFD